MNDGQRIAIVPEGDVWVTPGMIAALAERHQWSAHGIEVPHERTRDGGASILVAIAGIGGAAIGALIKGLIDLSVSRIRIELDDAGVKAVEIPRGVSSEELEQRITAVERHRVKRIVLSG